MQATGEQKGCSKGRCIVVVNDDPVQLKLTVGLLKKEGLEAASFPSAQKALEYIYNNGPADLIITDLHMPGIDGWRFCQLLRSQEFPQTNNTPIIVMSATFSGSDVQEITSGTGADAFISIPYEKNVLHQTVNRLLTGKRHLLHLSALIIEDNRTERRIISKTLGENGYRVFEAEDGHQAMDIHSKEGLDVIILDHHLPSLWGMVWLLCSAAHAYNRPQAGKSRSFLFLDGSRAANMARFEQIAESRGGCL